MRLIRGHGQGGGGHNVRVCCHVGQRDRSDPPVGPTDGQVGRQVEVYRHCARRREAHVSEVVLQRERAPGRDGICEQILCVGVEEVFGEIGPGHRGPVGFIVGDVGVDVG